MGTNYYFCAKQPEPCKTCGHVEEQEDWHIGKHSLGWEFSFRGYPGVTSLKEWEDCFERHKKSRVIRDEYGNFLTISRFMDIVHDSKGKQSQVAWIEENHPPFMLRSIWRDPDGWSFSSTEFC